MDTIGRVNTLIRERDISLLQLSKMSNIAYSTFSSGKRRDGQLSVDTIERICNTLGITFLSPGKTFRNESSKRAVHIKPLSCCFHIQRSEIGSALTIITPVFFFF